MLMNQFWENCGK